MKNHIILATIIVIMVGSIGITNGFNIFSSPDSQGNFEQQAFEGHLTLVAKHPDGTVFAYRQTDNTVTIVGKTCASVALFGSNSTQCQTAGTNKFTVIAVGDNGAAVSNSQTGLFSEVQRQAQNVGAGTTNATTGTSAFGDAVATITLSNATGGKTLQEAGLFDSTTKASAHMFARQLLSPTVTVNNNDQVTVRWTIAIG